MCGIAGGLFWSGRVGTDAARQAVSRMVDALGHRGPDGRGLHGSASASSDRAPFVVLGHTRLAILDVSPAGAQPMGTPAGDCITYNGETYNFLELKAELERLGGPFASRTDTEVLLRGYDAWGLDLLPRLRGMFAFGLWDPAEGRLLLARDRLGIKPLYYFQGDGLLLFASEVRALLATMLVPRRLDATALWQYLGYQSIPSPRTLIDGVRMLEPGTWITVDRAGRVERQKYWEMLGSIGSQGSRGSRGSRGSQGSQGSRGRVRELLREAVASHLVSDVPVGAFLSGGIDSTAVVGLMREAGATPRTFSVGFRERQFDESAHARLVAERFATEHTHIGLGEDDLLEQLPYALDAMDLPTGDGVNTFVISRAVRQQGIAVALSGLGGDEIFGGYPSFARLARIADVSKLWGRSPAAIRTLTAAAVRTLGGGSIAAGKAAAVLETDGSVSAMFPFTRQVLSREQRLALLEPSFVAAVDDRSDPYDRLLTEAFDAAPGASLFSQVSFAEISTYLHDVLLRDTDQMSMAHGLEVRVPLLDHPLVECVTAVPESDKWANGVPKRLLVESLGDLLPPEIVHRPKQGFTLPFEPWMRGALRPFCEAHLGDRGAAGRGLLNAATLGKSWRSFLEGGRDVSWSRLWVLVVLDAWLDRNGIDHAA